MHFLCRVAASSARRQTMELATSRTSMLSLLTNASGHCQPVGMILVWNSFSLTEQYRKMKHL